MANINLNRVILGGVAAGLVMNLIDGVSNGLLLGDKWKAETNALNPSLMEKAATTSTVGWVAVDFILGILLVWTYAAVRPRFGPGPRTALLAGALVWLVGHLFYASYVFMGLYSFGLIGASSLAGLVATLAGAWLGGALYTEPSY